MKDNSEISKKIYIIGHKGYIGRNLSKYLISQGFEIIGIDSRISEHKNFSITNNDILLDCSRIKNFESTAANRDQELYSQLLEWVASNNCMFLRVGSNLEVALPKEITNYTKWSTNRTELIMNLGLHNRMKVLLVPNIFGGDKPNSVLDLIIQEFKEGRKYKIDSPGVYRDFLSMKTLFPIVESFLINLTTNTKSNYLITSGISHQIGSIQEFLYSKGESSLISKKFESDSISEIIYCNVNLQEHLKKVY